MTHQSRTQRAAPRAAGFSLIEVLVIISIILVLLAIGYPAWEGFQTRGRVNATQGILGRIHTAATEYQKSAEQFVNHEGNDPIDWSTAKEENATGSSGQSNELADDASDHVTIERFVWAARNRAESEQSVRNLSEQLRDTDGDGFLEVVDAWDNPLKYFRSSTGSDGEEGVPRRDKPFFASAGPDGEWGEYNGGEPNDAAADNLFTFQY